VNKVARNGENEPALKDLWSVAGPSPGCHSRGTKITRGGTF